LSEAANQADLVITNIDLGSTINGFDVAAAVHERWLSVHELLISGLPVGHTGQQLDPRYRYQRKPLSSTRLLRTIGESTKAAKRTLLVAGDIAAPAMTRVFKHSA
jgi:two-component SAPR family response regulator